MTVAQLLFLFIDISVSRAMLHMAGAWHILLGEGELGGGGLEHNRSHEAVALGQAMVGRDGLQGQRRQQHSIGWACAVDPAVRVVDKSEAMRDRSIGWAHRTYAVCVGPRKHHPWTAERAGP